MTTRPVLKVDIGFDDDPMDMTNLTWTEITSYVRNITIRRGRTDEVESFNSGSCSLTLDNRDRRFDPLNTASPYAGKLLARRQIRIQATWDGDTWDLFRGYVSGWGVAPEVGGDSTWEIEGIDFLAILASITLPTSLLAFIAEIGHIAGLNAYLPLGTVDQLCVDMKGSNDYTHTTASPKTGEEVSPYLGGASQQYDGTYGTIGPVINSFGAWAVSFWFKTETAGPVGGLNPIVAGAGPDPVTIGIDEYGRLAYRQGASNTAHSGFSAIDPAVWHHGCVGYDGSGVPQVWVDGVLLSSGNATGTGTDGTGFQLIGMSNDPADSQFFTGNLAHIQFYGSTSPDIRMRSQGNYQAGAKGIWINTGPNYYAPLTTGRIVRQIALFAGYPSGYIDYDFGQIVPAGMTFGITALEAMQKLALTERGQVFVDAYGVLYFWDSAHNYTATRATTIQSIYTDGDVTAEPYSLPFNAVSAIQYDDAHLVNEASVTVGPGGEWIAVDSTSATTYGKRRQSYETWLPSVESARTYGEVILSQYADPQLRIDSWTVNPYANSTYAFPQVLYNDIGDRIRLDLFTSQTYPISEEMLIEQVQHSITPDTWETTYSGSPAVHAWLLEDATYGLLEDTTVLG